MGDPVNDLIDKLSETMELEDYLEFLETIMADLEIRIEAVKHDINAK